MKYNKLGKSDLCVSAIGLGCMSLDVVNPKEVDVLLRTAYANGINFFDTADLYDKGMNETVIGHAIKSYRREIVLATKVGNRWREDGSGWEWDVSKSYIEKAVDCSLRRLQTDYIDLYQIHGGTNKDNFEEVIDTMERLIQVGKIRYYGISSIRPNVFLKYLETSNIISNMMQFSLLDNRAEEYGECFQNSNVGLIARGVLAKGLLVNKDAVDYLEYTEREVATIQREVKELTKVYAIKETSVALAYVLDKPFVASALVGVRVLNQLKDVIESYNMLNGLTIDFKNLSTKPSSYTDHLY